MVQVHHFKVWNSQKGDWEIPPPKRTAESIDELKGQVIWDTALNWTTRGDIFQLGTAVQVVTSVDEGKNKRKPT
jgi:hypothetical protein